jgi:integrase
MANVRTTTDGYLFFDFRYKGRRCREYTELQDTKDNRKQMEQALAKIEARIVLETFDYAATFPEGSQIAAFPPVIPVPATGTEFEGFARQWMLENKLSWKPSVKVEYTGTLEQHLVPRFKGRAVTEITSSDVKLFRNALAELPGRQGRALSYKRINNILSLLRLLLTEAATGFQVPNPFDGVKRLAVEQPDIHPFNLEEVAVLLAGVRPDFHNYYAVRFFTGMRPGEVDGLQWADLDWVNGKIRVRRTRFRGQNNAPKTKYSTRDIDILPPVRLALENQRPVSQGQSIYVFCTSVGTALDHNLVTRRVWYPTLKRLQLAPRTPYQTRHTFATLMLAAGENPEWIARQMGHKDTTMLFSVYSRFVPNLTRQDGSAFVKLLDSRGGVLIAKAKPDEAADDVLSRKSRRISHLQQVRGLFKPGDPQGQAQSDAHDPASRSDGEILGS